jgi:hypothetical protein
MKLNLVGIAVAVLMAVLAYKMYKDSDMFQLKCIISGVDGNSYCVRDREQITSAADLLARNTQKMRTLVQRMGAKHPDKPNVQRLVSGFDPQKIMETLPTSEHTAYSENKGEKLAFCLNSSSDNQTLIDPNTLFFVSAHELAHIATKSVGHTDEFWDNFKLVLQDAVDAGLYTPVDYSKHPKNYCGMRITDSPLFKSS